MTQLFIELYLDEVGANNIVDQWGATQRQVTRQIFADPLDSTEFFIGL